MEEWESRCDGSRRTQHMTVPDTTDTLPPKAVHPSPPFTLAIDIGGTGLKASILDSSGAMVAERVKIPTTYPLPPDKLVSDLAKLVQGLPQYDRVSAGFPGMIREGHVLTAPHFVLKSGPGSDVDQALVSKWADFPLANALTQELQKPTKVANDADLQGAAVISGHGFELAITLGTGFGTGIFYDGHLLPHMEFAHMPFRKGETYNDQLGERARKEIGDERWNKRALRAIDALRALMFFDRCWIGGGNARRLDTDKLPDDVTIVENTAGILGGIKLWDGSHVGL
jgi:polyphosphate glucokinase